jgi:predicted TIM-barrel fold metal-dependent hydrolase
MIVDAHAHLGEVAAFRGADPGAEAMVALMDHLGVDLAIQTHAAGIAECFEEALAASRSAYEASGGRLYYLLCYHPRYPEASLAAMQEAREDAGWVGIKIHPGQHEVMPEDPAYEPAWRLAAEAALPLVTHSWAASDYNPTQRFSTCEHFAHYAERFPQVNLVLGHAGGRYAGHLAAARLAQAYPNVYADLSGDVYACGLIEWLVEQFGAERVLYGSDMNWIDPRTTLGRVLDAEISLEAKRGLLGENAGRIFGLGRR